MSPASIANAVASIGTFLKASPDSIPKQEDFTNAKLMNPPDPIPHLFDPDEVAEVEEHHLRTRVIPPIRLDDGEDDVRVKAVPPETQPIQP